MFGASRWLEAWLAKGSNAATAAATNEVLRNMEIPWLVSSVMVDAGGDTSATHNGCTRFADARFIFFACIRSAGTLVRYYPASHEPRRSHATAPHRPRPP